MRSDTDQAAMAEIAENLHRRELGEIERAELLARWVELSANRKAPEEVAQLAPLSEKGGRGNKSGIRQAARDLGLPRDQVARAVKIASLTPEAKAAGRNAPQAVLLEAAKEETAERQVAVIERRVEGGGILTCHECTYDAISLAAWRQRGSMHRDQTPDARPF